MGQEQKDKDQELLKQAVKEVVAQPAVQGLIVRVFPFLLTFVASSVAAIFWAGGTYAKYKDLPERVDKFETRLKTLEDVKPVAPPIADTALEERITKLEQRQAKVESLMNSPNGQQAVVGNVDPPSAVPKIDQGIETYAIMLNEAEAKEHKSGGFYLDYKLTEHICDVNRKHPIVESQKWQPDKGEILKLSIPSKGLESWCMVIGLYSSRRDAEDGQSILVNVSRPVTNELGFREPLDKQMEMVTVSRVPEKDLTNEQKALRVRYGI